MGIEIFLAAVFILAALAVFDLVVGVSNDAVNFMNSSIGSRVAPRHVILIIASLGILAGVTFSSGMMEVARKGIFHPHLFTMPELLFMFLAVMITNGILLDLFNAHGLPTSSTVSIVFALLGSAVAVSVLKILQTDSDLSALAQYINTSKAMVIIFGILLSVIVAFVFGMISQFLSRLLFTFNFKKRLKRYGGIWGGIALSSITYFILVKGAKGSSIITPETADWIASHSILILLIIFAISAVILQLLLLFRVNVLKPIILIGTFALAMAFAANDLVNFIGVPLAGYHAYEAAIASGDPVTGSMGALAQKVPAETTILLLAGAVMVITLWLSRKARTVIQTEIDLSQQSEGEERFESSFASRFVVRMIRSCTAGAKRFIPRGIQAWSSDRLDPSRYKAETDAENRPSFDLLRASVNLMVASAVISYATSYKLPLSTTYVTFMVAMGSSFADRAWGRESAVYRVSGVLTVVGGWFMTAMIAFTVSAAFATVLFLTEVYGTAILILLSAMIVWRNHLSHKRRTESHELDKVFNLRKVKDLTDTLHTSFEHMGYLMKELRESLDATLDALFAQNGHLLGIERKKTKRVQRWTNIITANIFKSMRLMQREDMKVSYQYGQTVRRLQKLVDGYRDIVMRSSMHVDNQHKGLLDKQIEELRVVKDCLDESLLDVESIICSGRTASAEEIAKVAEDCQKLRRLAGQLHEKQLERIRVGTSKTRLNILFYAIVGNAMMLSKQNLKLLEIYNESFSTVEKEAAFDLD